MAIGWRGSQHWKLGSLRVAARYSWRYIKALPTLSKGRTYSSWLLVEELTKTVRKEEDDVDNDMLNREEDSNIEMECGMYFWGGRPATKDWRDTPKLLAMKSVPPQPKF
ncbi:hypothetical protein AXF42_Ash018700 [Apostasia shenzhenica]|uniref:Uncharacterized protein n=1 Tax=Apostasia shenzhenica TaxID=1088818 RepID=A0A2H9ZZN8_9ASPA|nr:hypothetical protein AXF42_Ash018700 [Apostasia shenzhenica]